MQILIADARSRAWSPSPLEYADALALYDRRTRAAYEVTGARRQRFLAANDSFRAAAAGTREWYHAAERAYRLGLRATHAYDVWARGHAALVLDQPPLARVARPQTLRLRLGVALQSLGST